MSATPSTRPTSWWARNWKWFVPVVVVVGVGMLAGGFAGLVLVIMNSIKLSGAYTGAWDMARKDPAVIEALGEPLEAGLFVTGSIHISGPSGRADIAIPISGPRGEGTLYVKAVKDTGQWRFLRVELAVDGADRRIDLLGRDKTSPEVRAQWSNPAVVRPAPA